ncbi:MAG: elongation factor Ts [Phycisphaeraceae bacterium]|nr:MAG: elongation factor Ts [Phycisphaeraceae bacterium]
MSDKISAKDVMSLRNRTGLAMMACKKALTEAGGDVEKAEELLRKELKGKMETKVDRAAGEGRIGVAVSGGSAAILELKAETDFTAKNDKFIAATDQLAKLALNAPAGSGPTDEMTKIIDDLRISTGENISIGRIETIKGSGDKTVFGQYVHHDGKTGVLIHAEGDIDDSTLRQIGMHVTAAVPRPMGVTTDEIPAEVVEKERKFRIDQAVESGKNQEIAEKMVEGGMRKFFAEVALLEQAYVVDPSKPVKEIVGPNASIKSFHRWEVGEAAG